MKSKMKWGVAILIGLLIGVSVLLITRPTETEPEEVYKSSTPAEKEEVGRNIQDAIDKSKKDLSPIAAKEHQVVSNENSQPETVHTSSNPMFANGVPEHLQCPDQWIGMYSRNFKGDRHELGRINQPRIDEVLSKGCVKFL